MNGRRQTAQAILRTTLGVALVLLWLPLLLGCNGGSNGGGGGEAWVLLGADNTGGIYSINPDTAETTLLGDSAVAGIASMAYESNSGKFFAGTGVFFAPGVLYTVDASSTAAVEFVPSPEPGTNTGTAYSGMTADSSSGLVYIVNETECDSIFSVDPGTGIAKTVVNSGMPACYSYNDGGVPISIDPGSGTFYLIDTDSSATDVYTVDVSGDSSTYLGSYAYTGFPAPGSEGIVNDMAIRPSDGKVFVTTTNAYLGVLDLSGAPDLTVSYVGTFPGAASPTVLDGLTFAGGAWPSK